VIEQTGGDASDITDDESEVQSWARHSVVAERAVPEGDTFTVDDLTTKRPNTGVSARRFDDVVGATAARDVEANTVLVAEDVEGWE
jgi:sialic acid synthase SpsE